MTEKPVRPVSAHFVQVVSAWPTPVKVTSYIAHPLHLYLTCILILPGDYQFFIQKKFFQSIGGVQKLKSNFFKLLTNFFDVHDDDGDFLKFSLNTTLTHNTTQHYITQHYTKKKKTIILKIVKCLLT